MADKIPVKAKYSGADVVALQEFEPTDTIALALVSGFPAGVTSELANNSITTLSDVYDSMSPSDGQVLTYDTTNGWQAETPLIDADVWGGITGTLSDQTDLQAALNTKINNTTFNLHTGDATIHFAEGSIDHTNILNIGTNTHAQIDTHIGDATLHFTEGSIDHTSISNIGTNTHAQIDTHIGDATIHFTQAAISITESQISDLQSYLLNITGESIKDLSDVFSTMTPADGQVLTFDTTNGWQAETPAPGVTDHTLLSNIGTNTHTQIDTHVGTAGIHFTEGSIDHTAIQNIGTNTHAQIDTHIGDGTIHFTQAAISITESQISDLQTYIPASEKAAANGVATLGADSKIPTSQLPALAITSTSVVASEVAQLALTVQEGDVAVRSDENKSYIALNDTNATMTDWQVLLTPTDSVLSVDGLTGAVDLSTIYEPLDGTILKDADIGVTVQAAGSYLTSETSHADVLVDGDFSTAGLMKTDGAGTYSIDASAYITDYTVTSGDVTAHQGDLSITESQISDLQSYLTSETSHADVLVDSDFGTAGLMKTDGAGTYSIDASTYLTSYTVTSGDVTAHQGDLSITESQISDLGSYSVTSHVHEGTAIDATAVTNGYVLTADGAGNAAWVAASGGASQLSDLSDVNTSTATNRNVLVADGVDFESRALVEADISDLGTYLTSETSHADVLVVADVGITVAAQGHNHSGVYEPADGTILKDADIGSTVAAQGHNHSGVYEPADGTILKDADIGVTVAAQSSLATKLSLDGSTTMTGAIDTSHGGITSSKTSSATDAPFKFSFNSPARANADFKFIECLDSNAAGLDISNTQHPTLGANMLNIRAIGYDAVFDCLSFQGGGILGQVLFTNKLETNWMGFNPGANSLITSNTTQFSIAGGFGAINIAQLNTSNWIGTPSTTLGTALAPFSGLFLKDTSSITLGTGQDASIVYDGTNLVIDPKLVGAGKVTVLGAVTAAGGVDSLTSATTTVNVSAAAAPTSGQVLRATSGTAATWQTLPAASVFGTEFQEASSDALSITTATTFQQKLRMTTPSLPAGKYRIGYSYEWNLEGSISQDFVAQVQINDTITIAEHREEPKDGNANQYRDFGGYYYHTGSGVLNIDIDYSRSNNQGSAYIRRARLEIWRVS